MHTGPLSTKRQVRTPGLVVENKESAPPGSRLVIADAFRPTSASRTARRLVWVPTRTHEYLKPALQRIARTPLFGAAMSRGNRNTAATVERTIRQPD